MRCTSVSLLIALCALSGTIRAEAAPSPVVEKRTPVAGHEAATVAPHRAIYDLSLSSIKNGSNISDVAGKMIFEWADACDGWAIQQNLQLHFNYAEGDASNVSSNEVTWESKDGRHYNFNIRRVQDGKETENYRGKAVVDADGGKADYAVPEGKKAALASGTLFPSTHTQMILTKALAGEHFFTRRVFDGSDEDGSNDVSVFIGAPKADRIVAGGKDALDSNPLLASTAWPVHMAYFKLKGETGEPDYEMDLVLLSNGVARSMKIDYGDFSVTGTLQAIEPLPAPHC